MYIVDMYFICMFSYSVRLVSGRQNKRMLGLFPFLGCSGNVVVFLFFVLWKRALIAWKYIFFSCTYIYFVLNFDFASVARFQQ